MGLLSLQSKLPSEQKSKHERTKKHRKKLEEEKITFDDETKKYTQNNGEVFDAGYYTNKIRFVKKANK